MTIKAQDEWCVECRNMRPKYLEGCPNKTKSMVPKETVFNAAETYSNCEYNENEWGFILKRDAYQAGVQFAEEYLKDLAVEFVEWCILNEWQRTTRRDCFIWWNPNTPTNYTTKQLFEEVFIPEKYESNSTD